jgi:hypothetical protein
VPALIVNPAGDALYVPPVYAPVPLNVTDCAVPTDLQNGVPAYEMLAVGGAVIVTDVVTGIAAQPPDAGIVYVTVYVPAVLVLGVIAPVLGSIVNPAGALYVPPVYAPVPLNVTDCAVDTVVQNGVPAYEIVAVGTAVIVTELVAVT